MNKNKMDVELPLVSIIIPCFNSENYIEYCIDSALSQDYPNIEIIVVDDGSTDSSAELLAKYKDIFIYTQQNCGACVARNHGLLRSSGKYIKFLDSDDFLEPNVIRKQVLLAESLDENTIVYGDYYLLRGKDKKLKNTFLDKSEQTALLLINDILTSTPLHRKWMLKKVEGFDERFRNGQEWNLHVRLSSEGFVFHHVNLPIYNYRVHSSTHRISNEKNSIINKVNYGIEKTKLTEQRLGNKCSGDVTAALALRYWWAARAFFRAGDKKLSMEYKKKAKNLTGNYKNYWPKYYRIVFLVLGYSFGEIFLSFLIKRKGRKYV